MLREGGFTYARWMRGGVSNAVRKIMPYIFEKHARYMLVSDNVKATVWPFLAVPG